MQRTVVKVAVVLHRISEALAGALLIAVIAINVAQIFYRYVLIDPLSWAQEAMRYATVWMVMLGAASALLRNEHMAMSLLDGVASAAVRRAGRLLVHLCVAAVCVILIWKGFPAALNNIRQVSPAIRVPMTIPFLAIPVGAVLMLVNTVCLAIVPPDALPDDEDEDFAQ